MKICNCKRVKIALIMYGFSLALLAVSVVLGFIVFPFVLKTEIAKVCCLLIGVKQ